jgi:hypothetical protein
MKKSYIIIVLFVFFIVTRFIIFKNIDEKIAASIAEIKINEYCKVEHIDQNKVLLKNISKISMYPWVYDYETITTPTHNIKIMIDKYGNTHMNRMID